jgi:hypothetical protein
MLIGVSLWRFHFPWCISHAPPARLNHGQRRRKNQIWSGNPPRAEQRAQQLKEEILSNFRSGAMNLLARVRSRILKVKPTCLNPQVNSSQTIRPLRQAR